jgi:regulator of protease activity HflC (stomatin/prohibitin superfamily)
MSGWFWTAIVFAVIAVPFFVLYRMSKGRQAELNTKITEAKSSTDYVARENVRIAERNAKDNASITLVLKSVFTGILAFALLCTLFASVWTVPVQNVGIVTEFSNPTGRTTGSGLKFTWPWQKIADFDASLQTENNVGKEGCSTVRIGSLATACVENRVQWRVKPSAAPKLYRDYKGNFDNLRNNFVRNQIQLAVNAVFSTYNPLSQVNLKTGQVEFDGAKLSTSLKNELVKYVGSDIEVVTASVPLVHHDAKTEQNIQQFQDVVAQARILEQKEANANKEKLVADLQRSFLTATFLQNKCIEEAVKGGYHPGLCLMDSGILNVPTTK